MSMTLGIDVGTSSTKVLLLDDNGKWEMEVWPSSEDLWMNLRNWLADKGGNVSRVGITGHGPSAVVIRDGEVVGRMIPWHEQLPDDCIRPVENEHQLAPTRAWVPARLAQWESENGPLGDGIAVQLKDKLNWELTDVIARDTRSMRGYSGNGHFHLPEEVIGVVTKNGSELSGIAIGAKVICGCDDLSAGVLGLGIGSGDLFNLANTSEHVGKVSGEPQEEMSWLPSIGRLPALSYLSTSMLELNSPIEEIRKKFGSGEMFIGGGLALIPQLVESRQATFRAGQEVSVLGIAKLAQKPLAVIFGAGKVGRGFLAQLLNRAGWEIHFVDTDSTLISKLSEGPYSIVNLSTGDVEEITGFTASSSEWRLDEASLILTSLGANHLELWSKGVEGIDRTVDIILAENHPAPAELVRKFVTSDKVGVAQAQVLRSCIEPTDEQIEEFGPLVVQVQDYWSLPLDGGALRTPELVDSVEGFDLRPDFTVELTRKLYTYNAVNAVLSYIGHQRGYELLADAANDPEISSIAKAAGTEASAALISAYGFDAAEQSQWVDRALSKYQDHSIVDPIERQCRDPIRKLGRNDRLFGPIFLCMEFGLPYDNLLLGVKSALAYGSQESNVSLDSSCKQLQSWMKIGGISEVLAQLGVELPTDVIELLLH